MGDLVILRNVRRVISAAAVCMLSIGVTGCGFVNVRTLTANTKRTDVVVVGTSSVLSEPGLAQVLGQSQNGITTVSLTEPAHQALLRQDVQATHAKVVVFLNPSASDQSLALSMPDTHFVWIGYTGVSAPPTNVTWVIPNVGFLSSIAGYMAGGIHGYGKPVGIILGNLPSTIINTDVISAISSGMHCAYSTALPVYFSGSIPQQLLMVTGTPVRAIVVAGSLSQKVKQAVQTSMVPVIDINLGASSPSYGQQEGKVAASTFLASGLSLVLKDLSSDVTLPAIIETAGGQFTDLSGYIGWQGAKGVGVYQNLLTEGTIGSSQFSSAAPTVQQALSMHLPVPNALIPVPSNAHTPPAVPTAPSASGQGATSIQTVPSTKKQGTVAKTSSSTTTTNTPSSTSTTSTTTSTSGSQPTTSKQPTSVGSSVSQKTNTTGTTKTSGSPKG